ncbi:glycine transferase [Robertmurraya yapensis]|uniref:Glycine transferase n=1 Tax=Bacillus yapensis TaxID=2492960 RepID=A0A431WLP7_9BACI|nr:WbqC family protein [Bacillus yapensis]RTR36367.1 glycine transferase [Bacillus yapensis]TKT05871.1 glycine transferase [Bacillus yapensis]
MKLGIMQPYFFPYIGHFQLIKHVDMWVVFDDVQYIRHGWINRNRILHPSEGWQYIGFPVSKKSYKQEIKNVKISNGMDWRKKILNQLQHYKNKAICYETTMDIINDSIKLETDNISELNMNIMKNVCEYLDIDTRFIISSQASFNYDSIENAGDWALEISSQLGANEYINPINGKQLFSEEKFNNSGIKLSFFLPNNIEYNQIGLRDFISHLSIIDTMMFCSKDEIKDMLNEYEVI